jgi:farnesyl-diphosphate farnesyltransferase
MASHQHTAYSFCKRILPEVSRTFALNISVLTGDLKKAVLTAYLLCRIADTVEDSTELDPETRSLLLQEFRDIFSDNDCLAERLQAWAHPFTAFDSADPATLLVQRSHLVFETFLTLPPHSREAISRCVVEMSSGMRETAALRGSGDRQLKVLQSTDDLERYCYYVAGTVGIMLTRLFALHAPAMSEKAVKLAEELEVPFGLGLQLTNILKDCYRDYRRGWCYIPESLARQYGVPIDNLFASEYSQQARNLIHDLVDKAAVNLDKALDYTLLLPRREARMRLFCLWPLFLALKSLLLIKQDTEKLLAGDDVKISRREVYLTIARTGAVYFSNKLTRRLYRWLRSRLAD